MLEEATVASKGTPDRKPITDLLLDEKNPRLPEELTDLSQDNLLRIMDRDFDLTPIAISIVSNGYFEEEALLIIPSSAQAGKFIAVEGNRRLAALKFLTFPEARKLSPDYQKWDEFSQQLVKNGHAIKEVPVRIYEKREDLDNFLAYRHISGPLKWDPREKARFVNGIVERRMFKVTLVELAHDSGFSSTQTVKVYFLSYRAYLQAKHWEIDVSRVELNYSLFYTSLAYSAVREFLSIPARESNLEKLRDPVPEVSKEALLELIEYVNGTRKRAAVIRESREISLLAEIISNKEALDALRTTRDLSFAKTVIEGEEHSFIENLQSASYYLDQALRYAHRHKGSQVAGKWVHKCSDTITEIEKHFP